MNAVRLKPLNIKYYWSLAGINQTWPKPKQPFPISWRNERENKPNWDQSSFSSHPDCRQCIIVFVYVEYCIFKNKSVLYIHIFPKGTGYKLCVLSVGLYSLMWGVNAVRRNYYKTVFSWKQLSFKSPLCTITQCLFHLICSPHWIVFRDRRNITLIKLEVIKRRQQIKGGDKTTNRARQTSFFCASCRMYVVKTAFMTTIWSRALKAATHTQAHTHTQESRVSYFKPWHFL